MVGLCRLCASLRRSDVLVTIKDNSKEICEKLRKCCALDINMYDALPKSICQECIENLNNSYKFYTKVKEAQEALQALFPTPNSRKESDKDNEATQSTPVQPLPVCKKTSKENEDTQSFPVQPPLLSRETEKEERYTDAQRSNKENTEISLKQIKLENYLLRKTKDVVKEPLDSKTNNDLIQEVSDMLEMTKEETICESSYEILENVDEGIVDLTEQESQNYIDYNDVCEQPEQCAEENLVVEDNKAQYPDDAVEDDNLQPEEIIKQINNIESDNIEMEYVEYYDHQEEELYEVRSDIYIEQAVIDNEGDKNFSSLTTQLQISSWKNYKYLCSICENIFFNFTELRIHFADEHSITNIDQLQYKCYDCKKIIPRYNFFLNHVRSKHHHDLKFKCDVCDFSCENFEALSYHRSVNCAEAKNYPEIVPCNQCFKSFHNTLCLQKHYKFQHDSYTAKVKYKCNKCNKEFQYKSCLKSHEQLHSDVKKIACSFCDKTFHNNFGLEQHLYVHVEEKTYQCNICLKSFKTCRTLDEHQKIHTNEKPFKCQFCDKCFTQKVQKLTHERSHTGKKPYSCKQCDKRFCYRSALSAHKRIHTGDKPYSCDYCIKTFADCSNRNKHVRRMHTNVKKEENILL